MKILHQQSQWILTLMIVVGLFTHSTPIFASSLHNLVDDFGHSTNNSLGLPRQFMDDTLAGGSTTFEHHVANGIIHISGKIVPPRGQPGWASSVLPLAPMGSPTDASAYTGVKLLIRINKGNLTLSANSTEITNFDYHTAPVVVAADSQFHEVRIPFISMSRVWSEKTPLNTQTLNSLSIVAYALQADTFSFDVKETSFY